MLKALSLAYPQYLVLLMLWQFGELTVNNIGKRLFLESNTLTHLLKRLEEKKLITRSRSDIYERSVLVNLTEKGRKLKVNALPIPDTIIGSFNDSSRSEPEVLEFHQTPIKIIETLRKKTQPGEINH